MTPDLCIYHANCMDGFTAAWVVARRFPDVELLPASYGDSPPTAVGRQVLIVDFSYPHQALVELGQRAASVTVLDHHKTAAADLEPFEAGPLDFETAFDAGVRVRAHFDMEKSGARLAWEYCHLRAPTVPAIVAYTEDRDLWRWQLPESRAINAALGAFTQDLEQWDTLNEAIRISIGRTDESVLLFEGRAILLQRDKDVDACIDTSWGWMLIGGFRVPVANAPFFLASDIGNKLSEGNPFAGTYYDDRNGDRIFSLRSRPEGVDVSAIAKLYGGGGHRNAAGFKVRRGGWDGEKPIEPKPRVYPDEATPELHTVLRLMNFRTVPIAHALRSAGETIPPKTEEEQAFVLHWMIKLALDYPADWHTRVGDRLDAIAKAARAAADPEGRNAL